MRNASGTITTGNVSQVLAANDAGRIGYCVENLSTGDLWINDIGGDAELAQPSLRLSAGAYFESPPDYRPLARISIIGATTGQAFAARLW